MDGTEKVVKHLEMIQAVINRLGKNSFWVKSASLAIIITVGFLVDRDPHIVYYILTYAALMLIILGSWVLDGYFLWQERLFRQVYEEVRGQTDTDFSMDVSNHKTKAVCSWKLAVLSGPLIVFYVIEIVFALLVTRCFFILSASVVNLLQGIR